MTLEQRNNLLHLIECTKEEAFNNGYRNGIEDSGYEYIGSAPGGMQAGTALYSFIINLPLESLTLTDPHDYLYGYRNAVKDYYLHGNEYCEKELKDFETEVERTASFNDLHLGYATGFEDCQLEEL